MKKNQLLLPRLLCGLTTILGLTSCNSGSNPNGSLGTLSISINPNPISMAKGKSIIKATLTNAQANSYGLQGAEVSFTIVPNASGEQIATLSSSSCIIADPMTSNASCSVTITGSKTGSSIIQSSALETRGNTTNNNGTVKVAFSVVN